MQFINNAYLEIILLGALSGIVGVLACLRKRVFYTQALTHATFPGAIVGVVLASKVLFNLDTFNSASKSHILSLSLFIGAAAMCLPMIYFMNAISKVKGQGSHTAAGILLTVGFGLGFLLLKLFQPLPVKVGSFISGNILTSNSLDIKITFISLIFTLILITVYGRRILFACFDETGFKVAGFNLEITDFIILSLITLTVVVAMPAAGSILSIALIVGPAAGAIYVTNSFWTALILAPLLDILAGCLGLWVSIQVGLSSGGMITIFCAVIYLSCVMWKWTISYFKSYSDRFVATDKT